MAVRGETERSVEKLSQRFKCKLRSRCDNGNGKGRGQVDTRGGAHRTCQSNKYGRN